MLEPKITGSVVDITGMIFGRVTVLSLQSKGGSGVHAKWNCHCSCEKEFITRGSNLRRGNTLSCGCMKEENRATDSTTHGMSRTREYKSWDAMIARCYNKKNNRYFMYGERGITVVDSWRLFSNFFSDMGFRPAGKSLDRINGNKGYSKDNCKWSTPKEQANNRRNNVQRQRFNSYPQRRISEQL